MVSIGGYEVGNRRNSDLRTKTYSAFVDTTNSFIALPSDIGPHMISQILRGKSFSKYQDIFVVPCDLSVYETVSLWINGYWFDIPPSAYILRVNNYPYCALGFKINGVKNYILGGTFLRSYYAVFDMDRNELGLAPHRTSSVGQPLVQNSLIFNKGFPYLV